MVGNVGIVVWFYDVNHLNGWNGCNYLFVLILIILIVSTLGMVGILDVSKTFLRIIPTSYDYSGLDGWNGWSYFEAVYGFDGLNGCAGAPTDGRGTPRVSLSVQFVEIYNDKIRDLLHPGADSSAFRVREHPHTGPYVDNLVPVQVGVALPR